MYDRTELLRVCQKAANELGVSLEVFKRRVYEDLDKQYAREDIQSYLDERELEYADEDVETILSIYIDKYDCTLGTWDNIDNAYYLSGLNLKECEVQTEE